MAITLKSTYFRVIYPLRVCWWNLEVKPQEEAWEGREHLLNAFYVPATILVTSHMLVHLIHIYRNKIPKPKSETLQCQHATHRKMWIKCYTTQPFFGNHKQDLYFKKQTCPLVFKFSKMFVFKNQEYKKASFRK